MLKTAGGTPAQHFKNLLAQARQGSREALGQLLECLRQILLHRATRTLEPSLRTKGSPSDLVQETFLEAQRDLESFRGSSQEEFAAWLSRILLHNAENFRRRFRDCAKRQLQREVPLHFLRESPPDPRQWGRDARTPVELVLRAEELELVEQAAAELPLVYRQVYQLRLVSRWSFAQIGGVLHCSEDAARKHWARAVKKLACKLRPTV